MSFTAQMDVGISMLGLMMPSGPRDLPFSVQVMLYGIIIGLCSN
jgi:hypothetical protein